MEKLKVGIIFGGRSGEHDVSLLSATSVLEAIDRKKYQVIPIGITREGRWITEGDPLLQLKERDFSRGDSIPVKLLEKIDVAFPVLHGPYGEDGTIQGLFEMINIPYVGAGVAGSAVGLDKRMMKQIFLQSGLPTPVYVTFLRREWEEDEGEVIRLIEEKIGYPCFVKPVNMGSSVGISKARDREELVQAAKLACKYDREVIVEEYINCREIECSVLGNDTPRASLPGEVVPKLEFYDYEAKYTDGLTDFLLPAPLSPEETKRVQELAITAFLSVNVSGMARVDLFLDKDSGQFYVNELNTLPGFTQFSMYPKMWEISGLAYSDLISELIDLALERFAERQRIEVSRE
ncbi:MAG: D-alanine--D-alanine ligase [Firmicutes bacterium]|nr:D-alanine--D-alanine ligase [Bacillota bacterium]